MTFEEAWALPIGAMILVSDGSPSVPASAGHRWRCWRSHNFGGELVEKHEATEMMPRCLVVSDLGATYNVAYTLREDVAHTFELLPVSP